MNEIIRAMEERRSIRKFRETMPDKADLEQIAEAGLYAASGMGRQALTRSTVLPLFSSCSGTRTLAHTSMTAALLWAI